MNPNTKSKSWDRRKQEREAFAIVKAKENELKQEKEEERQVILIFSPLMTNFSLQNSYIESFPSAFTKLSTISAFFYTFK